jgi:Right handed beta helix region
MPSTVRIARMSLLLAGVATIAAGVAVAVHPPANAATTPLTAAAQPTLPVQLPIPARPVAVGDSIQAAIDAISATGGGTVALAAGTHQLSAPIRLRSNVTVTGQASKGSNQTKITNTQGTTIATMMDGRNGGLSNVIIQHVAIDCALTAAQRGHSAGLGADAGVSITDSDAPNTRILLDDVQISECGSGLRSAGTTNLTVRNSNIHHNGGSTKNLHNVDLDSVSRARLDNSAFAASDSGDGLNVTNSDNVTVSAVAANDNAARGISVTGSRTVDVLHCTAAENGDAGIAMSSGTVGVHGFRIHLSTATGNRVGISTSSGSSNGEVWNNRVSGNDVNLEIASSATETRP